MERVKALIKSKSVMFFLIAGFCLFLACLSNNYDYDLYARLIVGEYFYGHGSISYEDFLSYTPTHLWYDHEWGSSVVFYTFLKLFGPFGLVLIQAMLMFFTTFFIVKIQGLQKYKYPTSLFFIVAFLLLFSHQNPSIVRCHMFSFMFFAMFLYFLEKTKKNPKSNILWLVPPIVIIWNNLHGGVVSGLGMIFIYMIGAILSKKPWMKYFSVLLVSTPLLAINPYGVDYLTFLVSANTKNREFITEWWSVFVERHVMYYYAIFGTSVFVFLNTIINGIIKKNIDLTKSLVLFVTLYLGVTHVKLLSLVLIVIASLYYPDIVKFFDKSFIRFSQKALYVLIALTICYIPFTHPTVARTNGTKYPVLETEFIKMNNLKGNILVDFGLGSYTSYKLYDDNLIFMDGRYEEVYYDNEFEQLVKFEKAEAPDWDAVLNMYPTDIVMFQKNTLVYPKMLNNEMWEQIYEGYCCGVFVRKNDVKSKYNYPEDNLKYFQDREFVTDGKFAKVGQ